MFDPCREYVLLVNGNRFASKICQRRVGTCNSTRCRRNATWYRISSTILLWFTVARLKPWATVETFPTSGELPYQAIENYTRKKRKKKKRKIWWELNCCSTNIASKSLYALLQRHQSVINCNYFPNPVII